MSVDVGDIETTSDLPDNLRMSLEGEPMPAGDQVKVRKGILEAFRTWCEASGSPPGQTHEALLEWVQSSCEQWQGTARSDALRVAQLEGELSKVRAALDALVPSSALLDYLVRRPDSASTPATSTQTTGHAGFDDLQKRLMDATKALTQSMKTGKAL